ncbi:hypothetical protein Ndes2526B_g04214 [Nannochloris sp. 'desiccata']|nr:hypothetical protein KSW81_001015 [Chlorella desiccata (nom. nud.)]KAH7620295.1 putative glycosyltransferase HOC1 [Chlorella desiccata (nom. nud.)]
MERVRSARRLAPEQAPLLPKHMQGIAPSKQLHAHSPRRRSTGALAVAFTVLLMLHLATHFLTHPGESPVDPPLGLAWADLDLGLDGDAAASLAAFYPPSEPLTGPNRIPRIIHHLYNSSDAGLEASELSYLRWRKANPGWELRFYDQAESQSIVGRWFPKYLSIYDSLRTEAERRDLFRYLAVLKHGGVFADEVIFTAATSGASLRSLDEVVRSEDTMVTSWDVEFPSGQAAISSCYIRARQLQHRLFAAAPGHPALLETVQRIAATLETRFSLHPLIDALERTGPGVFTNTVLKHAQKHPPAMRNSVNHWSIRLLPQKAFGEIVVQQQGCEQAWENGGSVADGVETKLQQQQEQLGSDSTVLDPLLTGSDNNNIQKHSSNNGENIISSLSLGRSGLPIEQQQQRQQQQQQMQQPGIVGRTRRLARWWWSFLRPGRSSRSGNNPAAIHDGSGLWWYDHRPDVAVATHLERLTAAHEEMQLFPVSADFEPPFDVMTHLVSHGERQSGWDVSQIVSTFGTWQPSVQPTRKPSLVEALVGSLGRQGSSLSSSSSLPLEATEEETASINSTLSTSSGVLVDVGAGYGLISLAAAARGHRVHSFELGPGSLRALEASIERNGFGSLVQVHKVPLGSLEQRGNTCLELQAGRGDSVEGGEVVVQKNTVIGSTRAPLPPNVEIARGYSDPAAHAVSEHACVRSALRVPGAEAIPAGERIGALRISANGWEGFVLDGFLPLIRRQLPPVIAVEWNPIAMKAVGYASPLDMLHVLSSLGYDDISHSGFICDERWYAVTYGVRRRGGQRPEDQPELRQPTWCRLLPEDHSLLLDKANSKYPETLLFINRQAGKRINTRKKVASPGDGRSSSINKKKSTAAAAAAAGVVANSVDDGILRGLDQEIG